MTLDDFDAKILAELQADSDVTAERIALHRCLVRHGISRLPESEEGKSKRGSFAETTIGYVHIDHCELRWPTASFTCSWPSIA